MCISIRTKPIQQSSEFSHYRRRGASKVTRQPEEETRIITLIAWSLVSPLSVRTVRATTSGRKSRCRVAGTDGQGQSCPVKQSHQSTPIWNGKRIDSKNEGRTSRPGPEAGDETDFKVHSHETWEKIQTFESTKRRNYEQPQRPVITRAQSAEAGNNLPDILTQTVYPPILSACVPIWERHVGLAFPIFILFGCFSCCSCWSKREKSRKNKKGIRQQTSQKCDAGGNTTRKCGLVRQNGFQILFSRWCSRKLACSQFELGSLPFDLRRFSFHKTLSKSGGTDAGSCCTPSS